MIIVVDKLQGKFRWWTRRERGVGWLGSGIGCSFTGSSLSGAFVFTVHRHWLTGKNVSLKEKKKSKVLA
jgi:hypothetical protein